jgi:hypothetical protein
MASSCFPCGRSRHGPAKGTRARPSARRGAPHEPEHRNYGVLAPRSGRVLRHDQCALCGLTIHSSRRRFAARLNSGVSCTSQSMEIRPEKANDAPAVRRVNEAAFGQPDEADLVDRLRDRATSYLALIAVDEDTVIGHIAFSPVTMAPPQPTLSALGLAPMALGTRQASDSHVSRTV